MVAKETDVVRRACCCFVQVVVELLEAKLIQTCGKSDLPGSATIQLQHLCLFLPSEPILKTIRTRTIQTADACTVGTTQPTHHETLAILLQAPCVETHTSSNNNRKGSHQRIPPQSTTIDTL